MVETETDTDNPRYGGWKARSAAARWGNARDNGWNSLARDDLLSKAQGLMMQNPKRPGEAASDREKRLTGIVGASTILSTVSIPATAGSSQ